MVRDRADRLGRVGGGLGEPVLRARERRRTPRPERTSGRTMSGIARRTRADSFGLVQIIRAIAPANRKRLRSAIEALAPNAALTCVVSAVSRETISPLLARVEEGRIERGEVAEDRRRADRRRPARRA